MKIKRGNLLTVILAMLCAVAIALGVGFALPKNEAKATSSAPASVNGTMGFGNIVSYSSSSNQAVLSYSDFGNGGYYAQANSDTFFESASYSDFTAMLVDMTMSVSVPAYTEYNVTYTFSLRTCPSNTTAAFKTEMLYLDDATSSNLSTIKNSLTFPNTNYKVGDHSTTTNTWTSGAKFTVTAKYTNDTNATKTCDAYFVIFASIDCSAARRLHVQVEYFPALTTATMTTVQAPSVDVTSPITYDGNSHNYTFTYDNADSAITSIVKKDFKNNSTTIYTYNIATGDTTGANPIGAGDILTLTDAGIYEISFDPIHKYWRWDDDYTNTTRTITITINCKKLTIPTITNTPLTYDPVNGNHFTVDSNFDATTMNALKVTTTGIDWNSASSCFDATDAGTYSVKFELKDKDNYVWDKGANGTTDDQSTTVKVDPKKLTVPTVTAPQEYTGSVLQFVLSDFNAGQYIKVDGVTAANGSTVTGAGGAATTDTTDTFEATKVGKYTVKLSLRDTKNYVWKDDNTNSSKNVEFEITQKELLSTPPVSSEVNATNGAEWAFGDAATITITDDRVTGENISLLCYYDVVGGTSKANTLTATTTGNVTTITMPTDIAVGKYTLTVELNGSTGDNANYKITKNNTLNFEVTSGKIDPSNYGWIYTKDGAAGGAIADGDKLPFELKPNNTTDGVKYEVSIQIPTADASAVVVDTSKYVNGYQVRSGDSVKTYKTVVALKSVDTDFKFEVNGNMQSTCEVVLNWEIEKGTFDLSGVKWEYSLDGATGWTEYNSSNPPQYNDGYDITVRVKASTLPAGLTLDSLYTGVQESDVDNNLTATISASDLKYNTTNFNAPDTSELTLNWEIAKKNLFTRFKNVTEPYTNASYSGNIILKQLDVPTGFENYIKYEYYEKSSGLPVTLQDIKDAADPTNEKKYKVEAYIDPAYSANYEVTDNGATPSDEFATGSKNKLATATIDGGDGTLPITAVYDGNTHFDKSLIKITSDTGLDVSDFTVNYYKGKTATAANALPAGELPNDAGDYCVEIILGTQAATKYILAKETFTVTVEAMGIALPTLGEMTFNGKEQNFADNLSGNSWTNYKDIIKIDGKLSDRNVGAGNYVTTLELTDSNYKWIYPENKSLGKAVVKYALTADGVKVTGDDTTATYNWNIAPLVVDTTNMWNKSKNGATLNLPQNIRDLIAGGTLEVGYRYYSDGQLVEEPELKSGRSFKVEAVFGGDDAERNVQFKRSDTEFGAVSKDIDYTVPTSGAAAFMGKVKDALSQTWLGLPIWAWLLIALALIILLIIIIVVAKKRHKTKEQREEIKARKEEEKARKEEERQRREDEREAERQRREDERRMQQEKLEAERELARAKQEAELEKIRAQAQAGMAGAGMATMAMQQPAQQQVQQVQTVDNDFVKEMREQMAELRADNKVTQAKLAEMQNNHQMPQPAMMPMPTYQQYQQPMQPQYGDPTLARLEAQLNAMQAEQRARYDAEQRIELAAMRAEQHVDRDSRHSVDLAAMREHINGHNYNRIPDYSNAPANQQPNSIEALGAIVAAALKNMANGETAATQPVPELPQKAEQEPVAKYPSDAVITTTTTVDTTKSKPVTRSRGEEENFDVDGFYDSIDY